MMKLAIATALLLASAAASAESRLTGDLPRKDAKPLTVLAGIDTEYGVVRTSEGLKLRSILTRPTGATAKLPAIMLTQWVSCGSVDFGPDRQNWLRDVAEQSGMVFVRIERSGSGDSQGPGCDKLDYDTEVRHYREALEQVARHPWVDPDRILLFGNSLGATTAPLVAQGKKVAGIAVQGGGAVTYLERMINFDRLYVERSGKYGPHQYHEEMTRRIPFQVEYLLGRKTPQQIEAEHPEWKGIWQTIRGGAEAPEHYGRPHAWHWQAAGHDFLEAWTKVDAPVLVIHGDYDQFEPRHGHELIATTLNRLRPGSATFVAVPGADHELESYASAEDAYAYKDAKVDRALLVRPLLDWARKVTAR
jgi:pimeloyl-ACP methyl ester carboxylesterase